MLGRPGLVERSRLRVELHVPWVDTWAEYPWVVEVALAILNEKHLEIVVQVGKSLLDVSVVRKTLLTNCQFAQMRQTVQQRHNHSCHHHRQ